MNNSTLESILRVISIIVGVIVSFVLLVSSDSHRALCLLIKHINISNMNNTEGICFIVFISPLLILTLYCIVKAIDSKKIIPIFLVLLVPLIAFVLYYLEKFMLNAIGTAVYSALIYVIATTSISNAILSGDFDLQSSVRSSSAKGSNINRVKESESGGIYMYADTPAYKEAFEEATNRLRGTNSNSANGDFLNDYDSYLSSYGPNMPQSGEVNLPPEENPYYIDVSDM